MMSGEQHERAVEAMVAFLQSEWAGPYMARIRDFSPAEISMGKLADADTEAENQARAVVRRAIDAYHRSLAEQGVRLVEQPKCPACRGIPTGRYPCPDCNGTGYVRLVDLREVMDFVRGASWREDGSPRTDGDEYAEALERRFGGHEGDER